MTYRLSLLDKSPLLPQQNGAQALAETVATARLADALGYHRYWFAEHHGIAGLASAAPELLIAHLISQTKHIRLGSGGILAQHYAPYKIAEIASVLASLAPNRIDLGIGKSPGAFPLVSQALHGERGSAAALPLEQKLQEIEAWLQGPHRGADISPRPAQLPERFLLGASLESATEAARLGWGFVYAGHQQGDRAATLAALAAYEAATSRRPLLALAAFAAPSRAEAEDKAAALQIVRPIFADGHAVNLSSEEAAHDYARQYGSSDYVLEFRRPKVLAGTGEDIRAALEALSQDLRIGEFILDLPLADPAERRAAIELIAKPPRRAVA